MPLVSLIIHTASPDTFLWAQGIPLFFRALIHNLSWQSLQDFELIYVDTYHAETQERFRRISDSVPFRVKHVPVHPEHRYWYDRGNCYISAAKNTGILWADGELCVSCDDAEFFPPQFLERYWHHYKERGRYMHALHKRLRSIKIDKCYTGCPEWPIVGDEYVNDHRWKHVASGQPHQHRHGSLCFAGTSFSLEDALQLNGYNERMDGCKSLEDCDFGNRLRALGRSFTLDPAGHLFILDHPSYADDPAHGKRPEESLGDEDRQMTPLPPVVRKKIENFIAVENHGMYRCGTELQDFVANKHPLTEAHWKIIREDTIRYQHFDPLSPERAANLEIWKRTPLFDLRKQREALRKSSEWSHA